MKKTRELIEAHLKLVDVVVEVCDARIPASSRNPIISELTAGKTRVLILNKKDLADEEATKAWLDYFRNHGGGNHGNGSAKRIARSASDEAYDRLTNATQRIGSSAPSPFFALALNAMSGQGVSTLLGRLEKIAAEKVASGTRKANLPLRLMIVGIPNSGKSSLINRLVGKRATQVGDRPGVTRGKQWLTLENGMQLLDTPGILWPKFEDPGVGLNLAFCGSIRDEIMDVSELALELLKVLMREHADQLAERYGGSASRDINAARAENFSDLSEGLLYGSGDSPSSEEALAVMEEIARKRGYVLPGKRIDYERAARAMLDDFRGGKLGRITLENPSIKTEAR